MNMKILSQKVALFSIAIAVAATFNTGCSSFTKTQKGTAIGAGAGGTIGALIGRKMDRQAAEIKQTVPGADVVREGEGLIVKFDSGILFDVNQTALKSAATTNLQNLATSMQNNPDTNIMVVGYTDNTGSDTYNMNLSVRRAAAVKSSITANGVAGSRLTTQGKGETEPIADNTTEAGRAQNRRVEIIIIANDKMKAEAKTAQ
ncbi:MAG: OmpA family protein [Sphingobacteriaceae bacterium]|nr:MAG: OmpA family protein [Sphingobacteriaceae bacterium]